MKVTVNYSEDLQELLSVDSAEYLGEFRIKIIFSDRVESVVDFQGFLEKSSHPEIKKYLDQKLFADFEVIDGNINWNNYDLIFPISSLRKGEI
ncbi:DUF2442 domain-containing protein [Algoriphagus antarcticus]|uniref:Uncharacterized protein DUF2442 n=1 Tax=Algoriphagus antarcticus TaxID=238540 RepID=A0A3E0DN95_9BACT|nr:DUF2442 domain-containing protein [Algoriphagus antarcticus]REG83598.1 uncharacterized protein DUF2442 [Algoriphagus antarcticus]